MPEIARIPWYEADSELAAIERERVLAVASQMEWRVDLEHGGRGDLSGWVGPLPDWTPERPRPSGLDALLGDGPLIARVIYREAFPVVAPVVVPVSVDTPLEHRTDARWHVMGDGSLCLIQQAWAWSPMDSAADLIVKASGWYIEYQLMRREAIQSMTLNGIHYDDSLDDVIANQ